MFNTRTCILLLFFITNSILFYSCTTDNNEDVASTIISIEREALNRWCSGDPWGYAEIYADEITYFSPGTDRRYDGIDTMKASFKPIEGKVFVDSYELLNPKVQIHGQTAVLTFNQIAYLPTPGETTRESHWCCTEVYTQISGEWKIIHSHWSRPPTNPAFEQEEEI